MNELMVSYGEGREVTLSSYVYDEDPESVVVSFVGMVTGSTSPDATGFFELTAVATALGTVTATATDNETLSSAPQSAELEDYAPAVMLFVTPTSGRWVTLSGFVYDESPNDLTVDFTGVAVGSVQTDEYGNFTAQIEASQLGDVTATVADSWNQTGVDTQPVTSETPMLSLSILPTTGRWVTLSGSVSDENSAGLDVVFSGMATGTATTDQFGDFSIDLEATALGTVTASVTDEWGLVSLPAASDITSAAPVITNFQALEFSGNNWRFSGTISDESPAGLIIVIGGIAPSGTQAIVVENGSFSVAINWPDAESGIASSIVNDWWGLESEIAHAFVDPL